MSPPGDPSVYTKNVSPFHTAVCSPREGTYECFLLYRLYTVINENRNKIIKYIRRYSLFLFRSDPPL